MFKTFFFRKKKKKKQVNGLKVVRTGWTIFSTPFKRGNRIIEKRENREGYVSS